MTPAPHRQRHLAVVAVLLLLAGCGAGDEPDGATPTPGATATTTPAPTPTTTPGPTEGTEPSTPPDDGEDPDEGVSADVLIEITDFSYVVPDAVAPGAEVAVTNSDSVGHTVTSDDGLFDVAVGPGDTVTFTAPQEPGEYGFFCIPHPHMTATLVVG